MDLVIPAGIAAASIGLTYFMCIRPMRHGQCVMLPGAKTSNCGADDAAEITRLRSEIATMQQELPVDPTVNRVAGS